MKGGSGNFPKRKKNVYARKRTMGKNAHKYTPLFLYDMNSDELEMCTSILTIKAITGRSGSTINNALLLFQALNSRYYILSLDYSRRKRTIFKLFDRYRSSLNDLLNDIRHGIKVGSNSANVTNICNTIISTLSIYVNIEIRIQAHYNYDIIGDAKDAIRIISYFNEQIMKYVQLRASYSTKMIYSDKMRTKTSILIVWDPDDNSQVSVDYHEFSRHYKVSISVIEDALCKGRSIEGLYLYYADLKMRENTMRHIRYIKSSDSMFLYMKGYFSIDPPMLEVTK